MVASFLSRFFGSSSRRQALRPGLLGGFRSPAALESRTLLAGNVTAQLVRGNLHLVGDAAANDIKIAETAAGIVVQGLNGTTINGAATDFVAFAVALTSTGSINASLGAGNDKMQVDDVTLDRHLVVNGGSGNDQLGLTNADILGGVWFTGGAGHETLYAENSTIDGSLIARLGEGDDLVSLTASEVKHNLVVVGGNGADRLALDDSTVGRSLVAHMGRGADDVRLANGTDTHRVWISGGRGADLVQVNASATAKSFVAHLGRGDDALSLVGAADFDGRFVVVGGQGNDSRSNGTGTLPDHPRIRKFETTPVPADLLTARIDNATTGLLAAVTAARTAFVNPITAALDPTGLIQSSGISIATAPTVGVVVTGTAGRTVEVDSDGDGSFDDGTATLNAQGTATVQVPLTHTDANDGLNTLVVRQTVNGTAIGTTQSVDVQFATGKVVRLATSKGNVDIELFNADAPVTVANFLAYLARYEGSIVHRSAHNANGSDFIVQGGGFDLVPPVQAITKDAAIANEFLAKNSNLRGTLSMALPSGNPAGGTSEWFINTADNTFLNAAQHTVFGHVLGTGMTVVDAIHALPSFNISGPTNVSALTDTPLDGYTAFAGSLTGTLSVTTGTKAVTGVGTLFTTQLGAGEAVQINGVSYTVDTVTDDTHLTLEDNATATVTAGTGKFNTAPLDSQYIRVNTVTVIAN